MGSGSGFVRFLPMNAWASGRVHKQARLTPTRAGRRPPRSPAASSSARHSERTRAPRPGPPSKPARARRHHNPRRPARARRRWTPQRSPAASATMFGGINPLSPRHWCRCKTPVARSRSEQINNVAPASRANCTSFGVCTSTRPRRPRRCAREQVGEGAAQDRGREPDGVGAGFRREGHLDRVHDQVLGEQRGTIVQGLGRGHEVPINPPRLRDPETRTKRRRARLLHQKRRGRSRNTRTRAVPGRRCRARRAGSHPQLLMSATTARSTTFRDTPSPRLNDRGEAHVASVRDVPEPACRASESGPGRAARRGVALPGACAARPPRGARACSGGVRRRGGAGWKAAAAARSARAIPRSWCTAARCDK